MASLTLAKARRIWKYSSAGVAGDVDSNVWLIFLSDLEDVSKMVAIFPNSIRSIAPIFSLHPRRWVTSPLSRMAFLGIFDFIEVNSPKLKTRIGDFRPVRI